MKCPVCQNKMNPGTTNIPLEISGNQLIVVRKAPALVCSQCGETFIDIQTTRKVEKIVLNAKKDGITLGFIDYEKPAPNRSYSSPFLQPAMA